jgi:hypothetical protein
MLELHNVVRSFNIPAKQELLDGVLMRMQRNSNGQVDYKQYIDAINWRDHPGGFQSLPHTETFLDASELCEDLGVCIMFYLD